MPISNTPARLFAIDKRAAPLDYVEQELPPDAKFLLSAKNRRRFA